MVLMTAPAPPPPRPLSEGLDPPLSYTSGSVHMFQNSEHPEISQMNGKKNILQFRVGGYFTFHLLPGFLGCSGVSRTVPVFPVLVHADSLDEVLRCDYSKYFSLLDSNCTLGCLFLCILREKKIHFRFRFDFAHA